MVTKHPSKANTNIMTHQYSLNKSIVVKFELKVDNFYVPGRKSLDKFIGYDSNRGTLFLTCSKPMRISPLHFAFQFLLYIFNPLTRQQTALN